MVKYYISPPPMNPVSRLAAAMLAVLLLVLAFFFGLVVLSVLVGLFIVSALSIWLRSLWLRRRKGSEITVETAQTRTAQVIDAEYTVVSRRPD